MYGEPVIPSGGPSGRTCHQRWPGGGEPVDETVGLVVEHPVRQRCRMQEDAGGAIEVHAFRSGRRLRILARVPLPKTTQPPARIQIQAIEPIVDCGRYAVKRTVGDRVDVYATIFKDGHDTLAVRCACARPASATGGGAAARLRQRPLGRVVHGRPSRPLGVRGRRLDRSHRDLAGRAPPQGRGGRDRARRRAVRGRGAARPRRPSRSRRASPRRRATATASSRRRRSRSTSTACSRASARGTSSSRARGAASAASRRCSRSSRSSASTSSICRRCIRSGTRTARGGTTR